MAKKKSKASRAQRTTKRAAKRPASGKRAAATRTAEDVMTRDVVKVHEDLPVSSMIRELRNRKFSGFPVVDDEDRAIGLISQNDVLRALAFAAGAEEPAADETERRRAATRLLEASVDGGAVALSELLGRPVRELMTPRLEACRPNASLADVCATMVSKRIHRVVVTDGDKRVLGLISATDLVRELGEQLRR